MSEIKSTTALSLDPNVVFTKTHKATIAEKAEALGITGDPEKSFYELGDMEFADGSVRPVKLLFAVDAVVTDDDPFDPYVLLITRTDNGGPGAEKRATPGGILDPTEDGGVETALRAGTREGLEEAGVKLVRGRPLTTRQTNRRPDDVRIYDSKKYDPEGKLGKVFGLKDGDVFLVSTQPIHFIVKNLGKKKFHAEDDAKPGSAYPQRFSELNKKQFGIPDHFDFIVLAKQRLEQRLTFRRVMNDLLTFWGCRPKNAPTTTPTDVPQP